MNHDILAFAVMLRGLQAFKREKQQLRRAQRKAVERNKSAALEYALGCGCLTSDTQCVAENAGPAGSFPTHKCLST